MGISNRLTTTAVHKTKVRVANGRGGNTYTMVSQGNVLCRISMKSTTERLIAAREESLSMYKIFILSSTTVEVHDTLTVGTNVYEIIGSIKPSRGNHIELDCKLINSGS